MSLDNFVYIGERPWHGLGASFDEPIKDVTQIAKAGGFNYRVDKKQMFIDNPDMSEGGVKEVGNYNAIYREDNNEILGVINRPHISIVQNDEMFNSLQPLIDSGDIELETAGALGYGSRVFGCFKLAGGYKVVDDDIDHYFVVFNDHNVSDGKITLLNTPIRVVCENTLSAALHKNLLKYRVACSSEQHINENAARYIMAAYHRSKEDLNRSAESMLKKKVTRDDVERILDDLFPYIKAEGENSHTRANENIDNIRYTFLNDCMGKPDLANYDGTMYQIFNALTDFSQHYWKDAEAGLDLEKRMNLLPGSGKESNSKYVTQFLKNANKLIA